jgi:small multidrug resistance pump
MTKTRVAWFALAGAIVVEVGATLSLKAAIAQPVWYIAVVLGYASAFALLAVCLRAGMPVGVAYAIWGASGVFLTALLAAVVFGEALTPLMALGMVLIIGGVLFVESGHRHRAEEA